MLSEPMMHRAPKGMSEPEIVECTKLAERADEFERTNPYERAIPIERTT